MEAKPKYVELGPKLREFRKKAGLTQQQVADMLHLSRPTITGYEQGTSEPDMATFRRLAVIYKAPLYELLDISADAAQLRKELRQELALAEAAMRETARHLENTRSLLDKL